MNRILLIAMLALNCMCLFAYGLTGGQLTITNAGKIAYVRAVLDNPLPTCDWYVCTFTNGAYGFADYSTQTYRPAVTRPNLAINYAIGNASSGQRIYINSGLYNDSSGPIQSQGKNNITLFGKSQASTIITMAGGISYPGIMLSITGTSNSTRASGWYLHDFTLDGNSTYQNTADTRGHLEVWCYYLNNATFENMNVTNVKIGDADTAEGKALNFYYCSQIVIRNCNVSEPLDLLFYYGKGCIDFTYSDHCLVTYNNMSGGSNFCLFFEGCHDNIASHNYGVNGSIGGMVGGYLNAYNNLMCDNLLVGLSDGSSTQGMYIQNSGYPTQPCYNNTYMNNTIINYRSGIILGKGGYNNYLINNTIINCASYGILIDGTRNSVIYANNITSSYSQIVLSGDSTYNSTGNTIIGNICGGKGSGLGLDLQAGTRNIVFNNTFTNNVYGFGLYANGGDGNYFANNTITQNTYDVMIQANVSNSVFEYNTFASNIARHVLDQGSNNTLFWHNVNWTDGDRAAWQATSDWTLTYNNLTMSSSSGGTVWPSVGLTTLITNITMPLTATPSIGYSFVSWAIDGSDQTGSPYYLPMSANHTVIAYFSNASTQ